MSNASAAINSARVYLNDVNATNWTDAILIPILQEAFGELQLSLGTHRIPVIKAQTGPITIPVGITVFPALPQNITSPISMFERDQGGDNDDWEEMVQVSFLPNDDPEMELNFWSWQAQQILFLGATSIREVYLRYNGYLTVPNVLTDPLGFIFAERFLGPRVASIALASVGQEKRAVSANTVAQNNLYQIMQYNVTEDQRPYRRKRYRAPKSLIDLGPVSVPIGPIPAGGGGTTTAHWIVTTDPPDGISSIFTFQQPILYLNLNGAMLFPNIDYISVGLNTYSLIDSLGNIVTPPAGSVLMGQVS